ncbi:MAG: histidinol-phosphate transaminase [Desulfovibrio sp.]|jgi:histidinol-phosphate aminotransferase|nr:histidinol-phosphate transaminase [Desulfovibrio sp.]
MASYPLRPEVLAFAPYTPGLSVEEIRQRFGLATVVKMASNENPLGVSPLARQAIHRAAPLVFRYAQAGNPRLVQAIARRHGLAPEHIVPGNGSDEIIDLLIRACPSPGRHCVVVSRSSFGLYSIFSRLCGVAVREVPRLPDFSFDWQGLRRAAEEGAALVFLTTPDNPSGHCPPAAEVAAFARSLPETCLLVIDEAYMDFADDQAAFSLLPRLAEFPRTVFLRTFSKSFGLAGLRLGYGILPLPLADALRRIHPPFSVNTLAEEAGIAALEDDGFLRETLATVREGRAFLARRMEELGCRVFPSQANFILFQPPPSQAARDLFAALLARGLIIRPLESGYGLPDFLRVSVGTPAENALFLALLQEILRP